MSRPRVALVATTYFAGSHADVFGTRLIEGYEFDGVWCEPRVDVVSLYLEQLGIPATPTTSAHPDIGVSVATRNDVPIYPTVAEAIGCGRGGVAVDGVVIIGEHGDYERNEYGQTLYPRRRLFDAATSTMIGAGRLVPVFADKHLAWSFRDARAMYDTATRLGIPLLAGSSVPLAWRLPRGTQWPFGAPMDRVLVASFGPTESYGFHNLEVLQAHAERRAGGETGIAAVQALADDAAREAVIDPARVDQELLADALATFELDPPRQRLARERVNYVFIVEYRDGLQGVVVNFDDPAIRNFGSAARGPHDRMAVQLWLDPAPHRSTAFLVRQIESLVLNRAAPYPVERTLLSTGALDAAMRSRHEGGTRRVTPELAITYQPVDRVLDTGLDKVAPLASPAEPQPRR